MFDTLLVSKAVCEYIFFGCVLLLLNELPSNFGGWHWTFTKDVLKWQ